MTSGYRDYPSDIDLETIAKWDTKDPKGWFDFIENIWAYHDWGWGPPEGEIIQISTAGWSGNESIVEAMQRNILWITCFKSMITGGHYTFNVDPYKKGDK